MSSVLVCISPTESHFGAVLEVARAFVGAGWRVRVLTGDRFAQRMRDAGADPLPLPPEADILDSLDLSDGKRGIKAMNDGLYGTFIIPAPAQFEAVRAAIEAEPVDAIVHDPTFVGAVLLNTLSERPVLAACGIFPLMASSVDTAPFGFGIPPRPGALARLQFTAMAFIGRKVVLARIHRRSDEFYRSHGMPALGTTFFADYLFRKGIIDLFGQFTVPSFEYPRSDLPPIIRFFGPLQARRRSTFEPPEWWGDLDDGRPVVHVSQGTVANHDFGELVAPTLDALADEPVTVVVTRGAADARKIGDLPPLPSNARAAEFVPYDDLMPKVDVFVTNGGYGGLHAALAHGVPIVVAGDTEDKLETSARVAWSGAGISLKTGHPSPERIRAAVREVLEQPRYREASARIGRDIAASPGADGMVAEVARLIAQRGGAAASRDAEAPPESRSATTV